MEDKYCERALEEDRGFLMLGTVLTFGISGSALCLIYVLCIIF